MQVGISCFPTTWLSGFPVVVLGFAKYLFSFCAYKGQEKSKVLL